MGEPKRALLYHISPAATNIYGVAKDRALIIDSFLKTRFSRNAEIISPKKKGKNKNENSNILGLHPATRAIQSEPSASFTALARLDDRAESQRERPHTVNARAAIIGIEYISGYEAIYKSPLVLVRSSERSIYVA